MGCYPHFRLCALLQMEWFKFSISKEDAPCRRVSVQALRQCDFVIRKWCEFCKNNKYVEPLSWKGVCQSSHVFYILGVNLTAFVLALAQDNLCLALGHSRK